MTPSPDIVERLRGWAESDNDPMDVCMREAADEIERLRDGLRKCGEAYGRDVMSMAQERNAAHDRIAHLERVVEAADAAAELELKRDHDRGCEGRFYSCKCGYDEARELAALAYDAVRKGEG